MIGRALGPTWSSLRKGDVLMSRSNYKEWCVVIVLEDASSNEAVGTRALRIFDETTRPNVGLAGASHIRSDRVEIEPKMWEVIRAQSG